MPPAGGDLSLGWTILAAFLVSSQCAVEKEGSLNCSATIMRFSNLAVAFLAFQGGTSAWADESVGNTSGESVGFDVRVGDTSAGPTDGGQVALKKIKAGGQVSVPFADCAVL